MAGHITWSKPHAFCAVPREDGAWGVGVVFEGEPGYHVYDRIPRAGYPTEERAEQEASRLNAELHIPAAEVTRLVGLSMFSERLAARGPGEVRS
jgi:hypothetical protein